MWKYGDQKEGVAFDLVLSDKNLKRVRNDWKSNEMCNAIKFVSQRDALLDEIGTCRSLYTFRI